MICAVWATQKIMTVEILPWSTSSPSVWCDISWYFMIFHDISWYFMIFHDISWYFMIFHNWNWATNPYPNILSQMSPKKMSWQSTTQDNLKPPVFCVVILCQKQTAKVKMICCQHGREFQKAWAYAMAQWLLLKNGITRYEWWFFDADRQLWIWNTMV